jgi:cellulose synthase/poly-beta-1,6-N-acetylglucosamine synthase-like glycosyltransferase
VKYGDEIFVVKMEVIMVKTKPSLAKLQKSNQLHGATDQIQDVSTAALPQTDRKGKGPNIAPIATNILLASIVVLVLWFLVYQTLLLGATFFFSTIIVFFSTLLAIQSAVTLTWMLYAWEDKSKILSSKSPQEFLPPKYSFTAFLPARHEEKVIRDTILAIDRINYPPELKEILILCREDDTETIAKAQETIRSLKNKNIRLIIFDDFPINKPHGLNKGLVEAKNQIIGIFDAEDEPHQDIYNIINTVLVKDKVDVVQSGVQLMNFRSYWFSALNVLEYFFWFKSGLHFFTNVGEVSPLGGNTVFFKKNWLKKIGGWDEDCLTEDADVGIRLTLAGAKIKVVYDELHATQEETPDSVKSFIKQRTRWNQGFLQIVRKKDWLKLPTFKQKLIAAYILLSPEIGALLFFYIPLAIGIALTQKLPVPVSLLSYLPFYLFIFQIAVCGLGIYEFCKAYRLKSSFWMPLKVMISFYPYQLLLMISSFRAGYRMLVNQIGWEKTAHTNAHRKK